MNKQIPYILLLILLPIIICLNTWQNIALFALLLGYVCYREYMLRKEDENQFKGKIEALEADIRLLNEKVMEVRTKVGTFNMTKQISRQ